MQFAEAGVVKIFGAVTLKSGQFDENGFHWFRRIVRNLRIQASWVINLKGRPLRTFWSIGLGQRMPLVPLRCSTRVSIIEAQRQRTARPTRRIF